MLTLHESVLLFALHDDRGTVHSQAWLGLDDGLRGALAGEWLLRGQLEVDRSGLCRWIPNHENGTPILDEARQAATDELRTDSFELNALFEALDRRFPGLRGRVERGLAVRGAVSFGAIDRHELEDSHTVRSSSDVEDRMVQALSDIVEKGPRTHRRLGMLAGLVDALDLWGILLPDQIEDGRAAGEWVRARDPISALVRDRALEKMGLAS